MTTRIHIVNFGPDVVEVEIPSAVLQQNGQQNAATKIYQNQYADFHVYDNHDVLVREIKPLVKA
jgi:hypothetical protein